MQPVSQQRSQRETELGTVPIPNKTLTMADAVATWSAERAKKGEPWQLPGDGFYTGVRDEDWALIADAAELGYREGLAAKRQMEVARAKSN